MATEAQIAANRRNAEKSTGPRTADGKAVVAQNAVQHGLLAREGVLRGEDAEEFERHREMLLEQLNPVGALEGILATRIVDLTWRLQRAAQDRNETFGALYDRHTAGAPEPAERGATLGRMLLEDYSGDAVLERLLRYERRIEGSLFRNLNELRRVHDQGRKADLEAASTLARWREEDDAARKERAFAPWRPAEEVSSLKCQVSSGKWEVSSEGEQAASSPGLPTSNLTLETAAEPPCETNPISEEVPGLKCEVSSEQSPSCKTNPICAWPRLEATEAAGDVPVRAYGGTGIPSASLSGQPLPVVQSHGQDAHATAPPGGDGMNLPADQGQLCETNPICPEPDTRQVLCDAAVMSDSASDGLRKTNPISQEVSSLKCQVSSARRQAASPPELPASNLTRETAAEPPCETNRIFDLPRAGGAVEPVRRVPVRHRLQGAGKTQSHSRDGPVCHGERSEAISHAAD